MHRVHQSLVFELRQRNLSTNMALLNSFQVSQYLNEKQLERKENNQLLQTVLNILSQEIKVQIKELKVNFGLILKGSSAKDKKEVERIRTDMSYFTSSLAEASVAGKSRAELVRGMSEVFKQVKVFFMK